MQTDRVHFAPPVDGFESLGAESLDDLLAPDRLATWSRAELLPSRSADLVARVPLPGTPDADGRVHERPRGAGTGHLVLRLYRTRFGAGLHARLTHPRSQSLAERDWNLACRLREAGVATPDLLLAGARGAGFFARRSVLVVRELGDMLPFDRWERLERTEEERALGLEAVGHALARLERSRVVLPELEPGDVYVHRRPAAAGACSAKGRPGLPSVPIHRLPGVVFANLRGGLIVASDGDRRVHEAVARLRRALSLPASATAEGVPST